MTESFELKFAKIYPDFTRNLVSLVDNLSPSEIKLCMCIKMSYSNVQIKDYMKISDSTIANLRSSVRHKLGLERSQSLTNAILLKQAISHAKAGSDIIAPSDMMDGRIKVIRNGLEKNKFFNTKLLSYSAKYASNYYGPFRDAVGSGPKKGDRKTYQISFKNSNEY